jgi:hypothetical protein
MVMSATEKGIRKLAKLIDDVAALSDYDFEVFSSRFKAEWDRRYCIPLEVEPPSLDHRPPVAGEVVEGDASPADQADLAAARE